MGKKVVIALGGNAILRANQEANFENQLANVRVSTDLMADIALKGYRLVITHGNGPQVGTILRQNEIAREEIPPLPLTVCGAQSQGFIGYMIEQSLKNSLSAKTGTYHPVVTLLTQTEVDGEDKAFENPTKPIGTFYSKQEAEVLARDKGWVMKEDANRGYRRVVPSPPPVNIQGVEVIRTLLEEGVIVISSGGGGIPVMRAEDGEIVGIDAVIDKDRSALKLAEQIDADILMILTDVPNAFIHYGQPGQKALTNIGLQEAETYLEEGHFSVGSMRPKMEAAIAFAKLGKEAIICSLEEAVEALDGGKGTRIIGACPL